MIGRYLERELDGLRWTSRGRAAYQVARAAAALTAVGVWWLVALLVAARW